MPFRHFVTKIKKISSFFFRCDQRRLPFEKQKHALFHQKYKCDKTSLQTNSYKLNCRSYYFHFNLNFPFEVMVNGHHLRSIGNIRALNFKNIELF